MARLEDFVSSMRDRLANLECEPYAGSPWVAPRPLAQRRISIVSTAGLQRRGDHPFSMGANDFRVIPGDTPSSDIVMSHVSTNFDRSGFQQDVNVALPIDRLRELEREGTIGSSAKFRYSFMGATHPSEMRSQAERMIKLMQDDRVDTALLVPI